MIRLPSRSSFTPRGPSTFAKRAETPFPGPPPAKVLTTDAPARKGLSTAKAKNAEIATRRVYNARSPRKGSGSFGVVPGAAARTLSISNQEPVFEQILGE